MKFSVNDKIYDTDKAKRVLTFKRKTHSRLISRIKVWHVVDLYITNKGNWFSIEHTSLIKERFRQEPTINVQRIFIALERIDLYSKYFGELEEA